MIKVMYRLSVDGQRADLLAGGNGARSAGIGLVQGMPDWTDAVQLAELDYDGNGTIKVRKEWDSTPTASELIAEYRQQQAKELAIKEKNEADYKEIECRNAALANEKKEAEKAKEKRLKIGLDRLAEWARTSEKSSQDTKSRLEHGFAWNEDAQAEYVSAVVSVLGLAVVVEDEGMPEYHEPRPTAAQIEAYLEVKKAAADLVGVTVEMVCYSYSGNEPRHEIEIKIDVFGMCTETVYCVLPS